MKARERKLPYWVAGLRLGLLIGLLLIVATTLSADSPVSGDGLPVFHLPAPEAGDGGDTNEQHGGLIPGLLETLGSLSPLQLFGPYLQGAAVENTRHYAFLLDSDHLHRVNLLDDASISRFVLERPRAIAVDGLAGRALMLDALDSMHFLSTENLQPYRPRLWLGPNTSEIAVDDIRGLAVVLGSVDNTLKIINTVTGHISGTIFTGRQLMDFAVNTAEGTLLVVERRWSLLSQPDDRLLIYDIQTRELRETIVLPGRFNQLAVHAPSNQALLLREGGGQLSAIDITSGQLLASHALTGSVDDIVTHPRFPLALLFDKQQGRIAVLDVQAQSLTPNYANVPQSTAIAISTRFNKVIVNLGHGQAVALLPLPSPVPSLNSLQPDNAPLGAGAQSLSLLGEHFVDGAHVHFGDAELEAEWSSSHRLDINVPEGLLNTHKEYPVSVANPSPSDGASAELIFSVNAPLPSVLALEPSPMLTSSKPESLLVTGDGFVEGAVVQTGDGTLVTEYLSDRQLRSTFPVGHLSAPGEKDVAVLNPPPGGGLSNSLVLDVIAAGPRIDSLSPTSGAPGTSLTISGEFFDESAGSANQVSIGGAAAIVTGVSGRELNVIVPLAAQTGLVTVSTAVGSSQSSAPFEILRRQDFAIEPSHTELTVPVGGHSSVAINLTSLGLADYAGLVSLEILGLPSGVSVTYSHGRLTLHQPNIVTLHYDGSSAAGSHQLTLRASGETDAGELLREFELSLQLLPPNTTTVAGQVLHTEDGSPFVGARVRLGEQYTTTDGSGHYLFIDPPLSGEQVVVIDGEPRNTEHTHYASRIPMPVYIVPGQPSRALTAYLAAVDTSSYTDIVPGQTASVTVPELPNYELRIPQGAVLVGWDGEPIERINVRVIPPDRLPILPVPDGVSTRSVYLYYFFQPGGAEPSEPIPVTMNNDLGLLPGDKATLWYYDEMPEPNPDSNQWRIMGSGTVSADGQSVVSDPGVGIPRFCCGATFISPEDPPEQPPGGDDDPKTVCEMGTRVGNPVDVATGIGSVLNPIAIGLPGAFSPRLEIAYSTMSQRNGPLGPGTWLNSDWRLYAGSASSTVSTPSGVRYTLVRQSDGIYRAESGRAGGFGM